jgi:pimeloyl-ACP methyl ester carboxylesterase
VVDSVNRMDLTVSGVRLSAQRGGAGARVMFLHGSAGARAWLPFFAAIASAHELTVPDHPGFGQSENPDWIRSVEDVALLYLDLLEANAGGVHLIAHSLGGWIAAEMAIRDRTRIKSLTLIAPAGVRVRGVPIADDFIWSPEESARNLFFDQTYADRQLAEEPSEAEADVIVANRFAAAKLGWQPRWYDPNLPKWLHRARLPAHIIWGRNDKLIPHAYAAHWCELLPDARTTTIESAGHLPHVEQSGAAASATLAFLESLGR